MNKILETLGSKLGDMLNTPPMMRKEFRFTTESLTDEPGVCISEMAEYLEKYKEHIKDYVIESYIDSQTFATVIIIKTIPALLHLSHDPCLEMLKKRIDGNLLVFDKNTILGKKE